MNLSLKVSTLYWRFLECEPYTVSFSKIYIDNMLVDYDNTNINYDKGFVPCYKTNNLIRWLKAEFDIIIQIDKKFRHFIIKANDGYYEYNSYNYYNFNNEASLYEQLFKTILEEQILEKDLHIFSKIQRNRTQKKDLEIKTLVHLGYPTGKYINDKTNFNSVFEYDNTRKEFYALWDLLANTFFNGEQNMLVKCSSSIDAIKGTAKLRMIS